MRLGSTTVNEQKVWGNVIPPGPCRKSTDLQVPWLQPSETCATFWIPESHGGKYVLFSANKFMVNCYSSNRKLIHSPKVCFFMLRFDGKTWAVHLVLIDRLSWFSPMITGDGCCLVAHSCPALCNPMDCSLPGSSVHGDSPGKNTGVGCHALLQGILPTQESNPCLLHWQASSLLLSHGGSLITVYYTVKLLQVSLPL